jgi:hypothetical protein
MSGYLTNLLKHTFDPSVAMVQPRLNALFAPPEKSSAGPASRFTNQESESIEELTGAGERCSALNNALPRPLPRTTSLTSTEPMSSAMTAASTPSSPEMRLSSSSSAYGEHSEVSQPVQPGAVKVRAESEKHLQPTTAMQIESDGKSPPDVIAAKPSREKRQVATRKPSVRRGEEQTAGLARPGEGYLQPKVGASLIDQGPVVPGKSSEVPVRAATPDPSHVPDPTRTADRGLRDAAQAGLDGPELLASKTEVRRVLPAFPLRSVENQEAATSVESMSARAMIGWGPLSFRPSHFREMGRVPEQTEPTIEVTIGRIEVRGSAPAESRRAAAKPSPGLSLDEYLRRRSGRSSE